MGEYPAELRADFQQFYGLNLDEMGQSYSCAHAAVLATQLPRESRVVRMKEPVANWSLTDALLARVEYWTHASAYANSEDAKHGRNKPTPIRPPEAQQEKKKKKKVDVEELKRFLAMPRKEVGNGN